MHKEGRFRELCGMWHAFQDLILTEGCDELKPPLEKGFSSELSADLVPERLPCLGAGFGGSGRQSSQAVSRQALAHTHTTHSLTGFSLKLNSFPPEWTATYRLYLKWKTLRSSLLVAMGCGLDYHLALYMSQSVITFL